MDFENIGHAEGKWLAAFFKFPLGVDLGAVHQGEEIDGHMSTESVRKLDQSLAESSCSYSSTARS